MMNDIDIDIDIDMACPICCEVNGEVHKNHSVEYKLLIKLKKNIIWKNKYFNILVSLGPISNSHLLIVPNRHIKAMSYLNNAEFDELISLKYKLRNINKKFNKKTEFFEHGSGCDFNTGGSCIDHAHLHAVAVNSSVMNEIDSNFEFQKIDFTDILSMHKDKTRGYIYLEDINAQSYIMTEQVVPSQYLRQWYAKLLGVSNWNWRRNENISLVKEALEMYKKEFEIISSEV